jgi:hypothetical protein
MHLEGNRMGLIATQSQRLPMALIKLSGFDVSSSECTIGNLDVTQRQMTVTMAEYNIN